MAARGVRILRVEPAGPGARAGLRPGDTILAVNGAPVEDELALRFYLADEQVALSVRSATGEARRVELDLAGGGLGIEVEEFRTRTCNNSCIFCFVDQLPPGVRPGLRVRDDDYRLSFLHGNYITLTNLAEADLERIVEHALSPLYVSVHATDPALRTRILGRKKPDDLAGKLRRLIAGGITVHAQIVLMPQINDGAHLRRTVLDLYDLYPGVRSVAIVPLGLSAHGKPRERLRPVTATFSAELIRTVTTWQDAFRRETGRTFAYLADEFYLLAGAPVPEARHYDDFAQIEDGVGMVRRFLDDFDEALGREYPVRPGLRGTLVTGRLFEPFLAAAAARCNRRYGLRLEVAAAENRFLGGGITVAGLLSAGDIVAALQDSDPGDFVVVPDDALSRAGAIFLDDRTLPWVAQALERPVRAGGRSADDFFRLLAALS